MNYFRNLAKRKSNISSAHERMQKFVNAEIQKSKDEEIDVKKELQRVHDRYR